MNALRLAWIQADDPLMTSVHELRHEALFASFGLDRNDRWDDAGEDRRHLVAVRDGEVVGYACLLLDDEGRGHLRQVSVRSDSRRAGIGSALMTEAEAEAIRLGLSLLWLNARVSAEPFYTRLGYATVSGTFPSGRTGVPHVRMEKTPAR